MIAMYRAFLSVVCRCIHCSRRFWGFGFLTRRCNLSSLHPQYRYSKLAGILWTKASYERQSLSRLECLPCTSFSSKDRDFPSNEGNMMYCKECNVSKSSCRGKVTLSIRQCKRFASIIIISHVKAISRFILWRFSHGPPQEGFEKAVCRNNLTVFSRGSYKRCSLRSSVGSNITWALFFNFQAFNILQFFWASRICSRSASVSTGKALCTKSIKRSLLCHFDGLQPSILYPLEWLSTIVQSTITIK